VNILITIEKDLMKFSSMW